MLIAYVRRSESTPKARGYVDRPLEGSHGENGARVRDSEHRFEAIGEWCVCWKLRRA